MTTKRPTSPKQRRRGTATGEAPPGATTPAAPKPSPFTRDPRLPAIGTVVERAYKGKVHEVTVREDGFEYEKATYRSLSQLARHVTGAASINGFLFFGLTRTAKSAATEKATTAKPAAGRRGKTKPAATPTADAVKKE